MQENNVHIVVNPGRPDCAHASGQITAKAFRCSFCGYETKKWEQPMMANGFPAGHVEYHDFSGGAVGEPGEFMDCNVSTANLMSKIGSEAPRKLTETPKHDSRVHVRGEEIERLQGILAAIRKNCEQKPDLSNVGPGWDYKDGVNDKRHEILRILDDTTD